MSDLPADTNLDISISSAEPHGYAELHPFRSMSNHQIIHHIRQRRQSFHLWFGITRCVFILVATQDVLLSAVYRMFTHIPVGSGVEAVVLSINKVSIDGDAVCQ